ncbi:zinc finger protein 185 [Rhinoderma darwinii]|uniref:zinc finger protein 185 n=1 Tax=Rhinoderma darwinii TaxID=43563 RepID=UPI003F669C1A
MFHNSSKVVPDALNLTSSSLSTSVTESTQPRVPAGPGKISLIRDESYRDVDNSRVNSRSSEITNTTPRATVTIETINESHDTNRESPKPLVESRSTTRRTENSKVVPDALNLTSSSLSTSVTESTQPRVPAGPGKISLIRDESYRDVDNSRVNSRSSEITNTTTRATVTIETINESASPKPAPRMETKPKEAATVTTRDNQRDLISWSDLDNNTNTRIAKERSVTPTPVPRQTNRDSEKFAGEPPLIIISPELNNNRTNKPSKPGIITTVDEIKVNETRYRVSESLDEPETDVRDKQSASGNRRVTVATSETRSERPRTPEQRSSSPRPTPRPRESNTTSVTESRYRVPETLETTMLEASPSRSSSRTTVTTTRSTDPVYTEYEEDSDNRSTRTISSSREKTTTTTTVETRYENSLSSEASEYDPQSSNNKGVLFLKEYVNSRDSLKSPTSSGSIPDFSDDSERLSYSSSSSYLYSSAPTRSDEGPCTYCGREIRDCPKIILEHLNIHCHEYCFKCGICHKPMGDLIDSLFIHRDVVHCESCYEKLF